MRKKGILSRVFAGAMAVVLAVTSTEISAPLKVKADGVTYDYTMSTVNDGVNKFGIIAFSELHSNAHTNTNFITTKFYGDKNCGTNTGDTKRPESDTEVTYIKELAEFGTFNEHPMAGLGDKLYLGSAYALACGQNDHYNDTNWAETYVALKDNVENGYVKNNDYGSLARKITSPDKNNIKIDDADRQYAEIGDMKSKFIEYNKQLVGYAKASANVTRDFNQQRDIICPPGTSYLNLTEGDINPASDIVFRFQNLNTNLTDVCVINIDCAGKQEIVMTSSYKVGDSDKSSGTYPAAVRNDESNYSSSYNKIVFNFFDSTAADYQYSGKIIANRESFGTIIAPSAYVELNQNWDGVVVADKVAINAEYHRIGRALLPGAPTNPEKPNEYSGVLSLYKQFEGLSTADVIAKSDREAFLAGCTFDIYREESNGTLTKVSKSSKQVRWNHVDAVFNIVDGVKKPISDAHDELIVEFPIVEDIAKGTTTTYYIIETTSPDGYVLPTNLADRNKYKITVTNNTPDNAVVPKFDIKYYDEFMAETNGIATCVNTKTVIPTTEVTISKLGLSGDTYTSTELSGATLKLYKGTEKNSATLRDTWTTGTAHKVTVECGSTYIIAEAKVPGGYTQANDIQFSVDADGNVSFAQNTNQKTIDKSDLTAKTIVMVDVEKDEVNKTFSKKAASGESELANAKLQIIAKTEGVTFNNVKHISGPAIQKTTVDGKNAIEWTSTSEALVISKLYAGEYKMVEVGAPNGYAYAAEIDFAIDENGNIVGNTDQTITMRDDAIGAKFKKTDKEGTVLPNATLKLTLDSTEIELNGVTKKDGNTDGLTFGHDSFKPYIEWNTTDNNDIEFVKLPVGKYILSETVVPHNYLKADDIKFEIKKDGKLYLEGKEQAEADNAVVMVDLTNEAIFSKVATGSGDEIDNASLKLESADGTPFTDESRKSGPTITVVDGGKSISWTSSKDASLILKTLPAGTYTMTETGAPKGYKYASAITFTVNDKGEITGTYADHTSIKDNKVVMKDDAIGATFSKKAVGGNDEIAGATIKIKCVKDVSGSEPEAYYLENVKAKASDGSWTATPTFENDKKTISWVSGTAPYELTLLPAGEYELEETIAPNGYQKITTKIGFKIANNGTITTITDNDSLHCTVNGTNVTVLDSPIEKTFSKVEILSDDTQKEIGGATIWIVAKDGQDLSKVTNKTSGITIKTLKTKDNEQYITWKSVEGKSVVLSGLPTGTYVMHEEGAPIGYKYASDITFKISATDYKICDANDQLVGEGNKLEMVDEIAGASIYISKVAINKSGELSGATLTIQNATDNTKVCEWVSGDTAKNITVDTAEDGSKFIIQYDKEYKLVETTSPDGYTKVSEEIRFKVDATSKEIILLSNNSTNVAELSSDAKTLTMKDEPIKAKFSKVDTNNNNKELKGALITLVYKKDGATLDYFSNVIPTDLTKGSDYTIDNKTYPYIQFTSKDTPTEIIGLPAGDYVMIEEAAPNGYSYAENIEFSIDALGKVVKDGVTDNHLKMNDNVINATFSKKSTGAYNKELPDATIQLICETDGENAAPSDYLDQVTSKSGVAIEHITVDGKPCVTWVSTTVSNELTKLPVGTYVMKETGAPKGYKYSSDIKIEIKRNGDVYVNGSNRKDRTAIMIDNAFGDILISKKDILKDQQGITEELPGAKFTLYEKDKNGTVVKEWTSKSSGPETIKRTDLKADTQYVLVEDQAPIGYSAITDVVFKLDRNGNVQLISTEASAYYNGTQRKLTLLDTPYIDGTFSKVAIVANGDEVPGATLQLFYDGNSADLIKVTRVSGPSDITRPTVNGQTCIQWTSTDEPLKLTQLPVGNYRMVETNAPDGYTMYKSEITFQVRNDGKFYATANDQTPITDNKIEMVDEVIKDIQISKKEIVGNQQGSTELPGAKLSLHEGTAAGKNVVEPWIGGTTPKVIDGKLLKVDTTYVIVEEAAPNGYAVTSTVSFKIDEDGKVTEVDTKAYNPQTREVAIFDAPIEAVFSKQDTDKKNVEIPGATIQLIADASDADLTKVTAKLEKSGTAVTPTTGTNASGKKFIQWTSGNEAVKLTKLPAGKYTMSETGAPKGYAYADDITFTITADGKVTGYENNKIVMNDDAIAPLKISKVEIMGSDNKGANELPGAKMTLYKGNGTKGEKICEWISSDKPYEIPAEKFEEGQTYTIHEVSAPKGFRVASDITFTYGKNGTILNATNAYKVDQDQRLIAMLDDSELGGTYSFSKVTLGGKEIYGAKMQVVPLEGQDLSKVEKLNGSGGKDVVITKDSITWVTTAKTLGLVAVPDGKYKLVEVEAPDGYIVADPIEFIAQDGILTDGQSKVELKDLYDPNTTTVSVYSRYYNVETFDPNHEDIIQTNTPTANSTEFELRDENGDKVKIVNKIVTRREIADGVDVTVVTFVIDTTQWEPSPVPRTYTITESKKPTAKEDGGYTADDGEMVTTYTITKDYVTVDGKQVVNYDRVWSNKYQTNVAYDETNPDKIPLYSHTKTLSGNVTEEPQEEKVSFNATVPPEAQQVFPEVKSPKTGEESFPVGLFGGLVSAMLCLGVYNVISYKKKKEN